MKEKSEDMILLMEEGQTISLSPKGGIYIIRYAIFYITSVISWRSVLLVEETGVPTNLPQVTDKLDHIMLYGVH